MNKEEILELVPSIGEEDAQAISELWNEALLKEKEDFNVEKIRKEAYLDAKRELEKENRENALENALLGANSKNVKALKALVDFEKVSFEDGKVTGLSEQIDALKKECGYLFFDEEEKPKFTNGLTPFENRLDLSGLSYKERLKLYREMPDIYDRLAR